MRKIKHALLVAGSLFAVSVFSFMSCNQGNTTKKSTVTFVTEKGTTPDSFTVVQSSAIDETQIPAMKDIIVGDDYLKSGYHFAGWYDAEDTMLEPGYVVKDNVEFTAKWIDRVVLTSTNVNEFGKEENVLKYTGKQLYIYADKTVTDTTLIEAFTNGQFRYMRTSENGVYIYIYSILDLSDVTDPNLKFSLCGNVQKLILSKSVSRISSVSNAHLLEEIEISPENTNYTVIDGILYNKEITAIKGFPRAKKLEKYVLPETITTLVGSDIDQQENSSTKEVELHENLVAFGGKSFYRFRGLEKVTFKGTTPPAMNFDSKGYCSFDACSSAIKFYVPAGSKQAYIDAWTEWYGKTDYDGELSDRIIEY